jgi:hypothetical protein
MPTVSEIFPSKWLKAEDLRGRTVRVHVESAQIEPIRNPRTNQEEPKIVIRFHGKQKSLILNKTQAFALAAATGEEEITRWRGHEVTLSPSVAPNKMATIQIGKPEQKPQSTPAPAAAAPADERADNGEEDEAEDEDAALWLATAADTQDTEHE